MIPRLKLADERHLSAPLSWRKGKLGQRRCGVCGAYYQPPGLIGRRAPVDPFDQAAVHFADFLAALSSLGRRPQQLCRFDTKRLWAEAGEAPQHRPGQVEQRQLLILE